jgi:DeoR/GlpR family transcriptional regulator of sugar metabolism
MRKLTRGVPIDNTLREIETRHNQLKVFPSTPAVRQLQDGEIFFIDDGTTRYLAIRSGSSIRKVEVS